MNEKMSFVNDFMKAFAWCAIVIMAIISVGFFGIGILFFLFPQIIPTIIFKSIGVLAVGLGVVLFISVIAVLLRLAFQKKNVVVVKVIQE